MNSVRRPETKEDILNVEKRKQKVQTELQNNSGLFAEVHVKQRVMYSKSGKDHKEGDRDSTKKRLENGSHKS